MLSSAFSICRRNEPLVLVIEAYYMFWIGRKKGKEISDGDMVKIKLVG